MRADVLGVERRRRWTADEKARIIEETLSPGAKVSEVACRNDVAKSVLFAWRRKARVSDTAVTPFVPVAVAAAPPIQARRVRAPNRATKATGGVIEIDLGGGRRVRVGANVDADALARVLDVLERR